MHLAGLHNYNTELWPCQIVQMGFITELQNVTKPKPNNCTYMYLSEDSSLEVPLVSELYGTFILLLLYTKMDHFINLIIICQVAIIVF